MNFWWSTIKPIIWNIIEELKMTPVLDSVESPLSKSGRTVGDQYEMPVRYVTSNVE